MTKNIAATILFFLALSACTQKDTAPSYPPEMSEAMCYISYGEDHYTGVSLNIAKVGILVGSVKDYIQNYEAGRYDIRDLTLSAHPLSGETNVTLIEGENNFEQTWTILPERIEFPRQGWAFGDAEPIDCTEMKQIFDDLDKVVFEPSNRDFGDNPPG